MRRVHLFEFEDLDWFPKVVRDAGTSYLRLVAQVTGQPRHLLPVLADALRRSGARRILDLCSGGGGSLVGMLDGLAGEGLDVRIRLTDLHPNRRALAKVARCSGGRLEFEPKSVDARAVPPELTGLRTLFNGLHHFRPDEAHRILRDAARARQPVVVCEVTRRHPLAIFAVMTSPVWVALLIPFLRPFDWRWLVLTYVVPLIPLMVVWDGVVSCLRAYSQDELRALVEGISAPDYVWEIGEVSLGAPAMQATYLLGMPGRS